MQKIDFSYGVGKEFNDKRKKEAASKLASLLDVKEIFKSNVNMITEDAIDEQIKFYSKILEKTFQNQRDSSSDDRSQEKGN